jgi:DNA-binding beta-propeller fold protein YncE
MKSKQAQKLRGLLLLALIISLTMLSTNIKADTGTCGGVTITLPFNDVMASPFFCQIAAAYFSGLTNGTTATTYSPTQTVTREQMAAFISRTLDQSLKRGSQRAVTKKWWTPQNANSVTLTDLGGAGAEQVQFDGTDLWVTIGSTGQVKRIRTSDGKVLDTWTGATSAAGILCAMGRVFITGATNSGSLYMIDPTQPAGAVTTLTTSLGAQTNGIAFDGSRIWTANTGSSSVSIITLNPTAVTTVSAGFTNPFGMLYDGSNIWVTDGVGTLLKLNADGSIAQSITVGDFPQHPVFDGTNIWVPKSVNSMSVVRVKDAAGNPLANAFTVAGLLGNGMSSPVTAAFDGERILVTNFGDGTVSMWKAADLSPLGSFPVTSGVNPRGACSDGLNFWIVLQTANKLARF